jgi:phosphomannomutase
VVTLRTSGTEPKIKYYSEMKGSDETETAKLLAMTIESMVQELLQPEVNELIAKAD